MREATVVLDNNTNYITRHGKYIRYYFNSRINFCYVVLLTTQVYSVK